MFAEKIGVLILAYNESANIDRTLSKLNWTRRILVVDSGSTDGTIDSVRRLPQAEVVHRKFDDFASQCNFGLSRIGTEWVLSLDADYELSDELVAEMRGLDPTPDTSGYRAHFVYSVFGRRLRGTLYPPRIVLYRRDRARYRNEGHGHRVDVQGNVLPVQAPIYHDDRKSLARWFASQRRYAQIEAAHLLEADSRNMTLADRLRLLGGPAPFAVFLYALFVKRGLLDGLAGWFYALQRMFAETLLAIEITERRLREAAHAKQRKSDAKSEQAPT